MIRINLLPYREKKKEATLKQQIIVIAGSFVLFLLLMASFYFYLVWDVANLNKEARVLQERSALLAKQVGDVEAFKRDKAELEKKLAVIKALEEKRFSAAILLDQLSYLTPTKDVWLDRVRQEVNDLIIEGFARDNLAVARLMKNVERSPRFEAVELIVSKQVEVENVPVQQFIVRGVFIKEKQVAADKAK